MCHRPVDAPTPPAHKENRAHDPRVPYNKRALFLRDGEFKPDPTPSAEWNRGAYLVQGLGHCTMCHTTINALGGDSASKEFHGGLIPVQNWYAPSLTSNKEACNIARNTTPDDIDAAAS